MNDRLATAAREILKQASEPVEVGHRHERESYVLLPAWALDRLTDALTPEQNAPAPYISISPKMQFGSPVLHGTRLYAEFIAERYWDLGDRLESEILEAYDLTVGDVVVCCWFVATAGSRTWRKRWGPWANQISETTTVGAGWWGDFSAVELPPHRTTPAQPPAPSDPGTAS